MSITLNEFLSQLALVPDSSSAWALAQTHSASLPHGFVLVASGSPILDETLIDKLLKIDPSLAQTLATNPALTTPLVNYLATRLTDALVPGLRHQASLALAPFATPSLKALMSRGSLPAPVLDRLYKQALSKSDGANLALCGQALRVTLERSDLTVPQLEDLAKRWLLTKSIWLAIKSHLSWSQPETWHAAIDTIPIYNENVWSPLFKSFPDIINKPFIQEWLETEDYPGLDDALVVAARTNVANALFTTYFRVFAKRDPFLAARTLKSVPSSVTVILDPMDLKPLLTHADRLVREIGIATAKRLYTRRQIEKRAPII